MTEVLEEPFVQQRAPKATPALRRVLIVEDSADIRHLLRFLLQSIGVQIFTKRSRQVFRLVWV
ncbi:MAG: hypothetical protein AB8C46_23215 [Burkholderiaceae bacterium]